MTRNGIIALCAVALTFSPRSAIASSPVIASPAEQCRTAIAAAEQTAAVPPHLLAAIGQVESGKRDPVTGQILPWPWTINVGGRGTLFPNKEEAILAVRALWALRVHSIDVGCLQINLAQHPNAFVSLEEAFDPVVNTRYGADFLVRLFKITGDWRSAAALYHSASPALGVPYQRKVFDVYLGPRNAELRFTQRRTSSLLLQQLANSWAATLDDRSGSPAPAPPASALLAGRPQERGKSALF